MIYSSLLFFFVIIMLWYLYQMVKINTESVKNIDKLYKRGRKSSGPTLQDVPPILSKNKNTSSFSRLGRLNNDFCTRCGRGFSLCKCDCQQKKSKNEVSGEQDKSNFFDLLDVILDNTKEPKKIKKQKIVNRNIIDPITGDRLPIVRCHCGATYSEDSYNLYGCDCEKKVVSEK